MNQNRTMEPAICKTCGVHFVVASTEVKRGKGKTCSRGCAAALAALGRKSQSGASNPNWRGGVPRDQKYRDAKRTYRDRHPEKALAHRLTRNAIRNGDLNPLGCEVCGQTAEAHHDDYSQPLVVRWLCRFHHSEHHKRARAA